MITSLLFAGLALQSQAQVNAIDSVMNHVKRPLQNLTPSSIILVFEHYWLTRSQYF